MRKGDLARIEQPPSLRQLGVGVVQQVRGEKAKLEFQPTPFSRPPYIAETKIVDLESLAVLESPLELLAGGTFDDPWRFDLKQMAAYLIICNRGGQLSNARADLVPHQIMVAHQVVTSPRRRFLLADEVGLGKTIEAGMVFLALWQRGKANRTLIVTPAGLTRQWREEMKDKFDVDFFVFREDFTDRNPRIWDLQNLAIASIDTLKRFGREGEKDHRDYLLECRPWDLIVFDEAHKLSARAYGSRTERTQNFRLADELRTRTQALLLLTATPHQGDETRFRNLVGLLADQVLYPDSMPELFPAGSGVRFEDLIIRNQKDRVTDFDGNPLFHGKDTHQLPVRVTGKAEREFYAAVVRYLQDGYGTAYGRTDERTQRALGFVMSTFQKLAASSTRAIKESLIRRRQNLISRAMPEWDEEYDARYQGEADVREALLSVDPLSAAEVGMLDRLVQLADGLKSRGDLEADAKGQKLLEVIDGVSRDDPQQKVLIFTEYLGTQAYLKELLEQRYGPGCVVLIRGAGMDLDARKLSQKAFLEKPEVRFLVSTEAGGEGINLQRSCHIVVNYDLPWNPMRIEQRVGRVYRYGQQKRVQVFNLENAGTIEAKVRAYMEEKTLRAARALAKVTGQDPEEIRVGLLGQMEETLDFEEVYRQAMARGDERWSKQQIDAAVTRAQEAYEIAYGSLFSKPLTRFNPDQFNREVRSPLNLRDLQAFVEAFLRHHRREVRRDREGLVEFLVPDVLKGLDLPERYQRVTFDRETAIKSPDIEFVAFGHALMSALMDTCGDYAFGGLTAKRVIENQALRGTTGIQFNFIVRQQLQTDLGEEMLFSIHPVFVDEHLQLQDKAAQAALNAYSSTKGAEPLFGFTRRMDAEQCYEVARKHVEDLAGSRELWDEEVLLLNAAWVVFV